VAAVEQVLRAGGYRASGPVPIVPMRIQSLKGRKAMVARADSADDGAGARPGPGNWAVRREYRSTYRDTLVASERLVSGRWWTRGAGASEISIERDVASELGVGVGDEIVWDVQGVPLTTRIASVREVDWARFEPNFFVVFAPGALESAPQTALVMTRISPPPSVGPCSAGSPSGCPTSPAWTCRTCRPRWSG
jgi:Predicted ABC-type transport system involved in lysophospholipase L1 biosynthesis, permease component